MFAGGDADGLPGEEVLLRTGYGASDEYFSMLSWDKVAANLVTVATPTSAPVGSTSASFDQFFGNGSAARRGQGFDCYPSERRIVRWGWSYLDNCKHDV